MNKDKEALVYVKGGGSLDNWSQKFPIGSRFYQAWEQVLLSAASGVHPPGMSASVGELPIPRGAARPGGRSH
jgi:hypothetical protein